ncbi:HIT finger domain-containing protein [Blumeria hordei DH14]|uniref:HIT finger domain-containing protein n=1 Tax=Blumeria graminis f. sp. hordei (strain DH14) TaxID=546991 RepID=N1JHK3_BLUG1|nr:HIT finger domain-containing protein [Blumeria hordei DH14]
MFIQEIENAESAGPVRLDSGNNIPDIRPLQVQPSTSSPATDCAQPSKSRTKAICGVCATRESQYKCARCYLPYCSLACSTVHKESHPPLSPRKTQTQKPYEVANSILEPQHNHIQDSYQPNEPFASLGSSEDLQILFKNYPNLPNVLERIHEATLPPTSQANPSGVAERVIKGKKEPPWTNDIGLQKGVTALHAAKVMGDRDGEGIRAYSQLVMSIVNGDTTANTVERIRQELAEQDTRIIERLLNNNM